jgi:hypothetical protein
VRAECAYPKKGEAAAPRITLPPKTIAGVPDERDDGDGFRAERAR